MVFHKLFLKAFVITISIISSVVIALSAPLTDPDNQHNLSSNATHGGPQAQPVATGGTDQICIFCHTPHAATPESTLWSRPDPNTSTFPLYAQPLVIKGDLGGDPAGQVSRSQYNASSFTYPNGASRLCLSCHDGVTAIGILRDGTSIAMLSSQDFVPAGKNVIDLSTSHPISFVYNSSVLADIVAVRGATYQLPPNLTIPAPLDGKDRMQCTTCHDPHDDTSLDGGGLPPFWRWSGTPIVDEYDDVCNQCHIGGSPAGPSGDHDPGPGI